MILKLEHITGGYTKGISIIKGVDLEVESGEVLAVIGQNGAGKSTLAKAIINILPYRNGKLYLKGEDVSILNTRQLNKKGITYYMQGGRVFNTLSVKENIHFVSINGNKSNYDELLSVFPALRKHWLDDAGMLSGGERHQLALAMALVQKPELLILDEPSAGLSPVATDELYQILQTIKKEKVTIILIEQNISKAIAFSHRIAVLQDGMIETVLVSDENAVDKVQEIFFDLKTT